MFSFSLLRRCSPSPSPPKGLITTNIVGGLGNQLFLIANLLATANRNNLIPYIPINELNESSSVFEPRPTYWNTSLFSETLLQTIYHSPQEALIRYLIENKKIDPEKGDFSALQSPEVQSMLGDSSSSNNSSSSSSIKIIPELGADAKNIIIRPEEEHENAKHFQLGGFFQSDRYFDDFSSSIIPILQPPSLAQEAKKSLMTAITNNNNKSNSSEQHQNQQQHQQHVVGLHVRRGDYLKLKETFEILDADTYYFEAMEMLFGTMLFSRKFSVSSSSSSPPKNFFYGSQSGCHSPLFRVLIFSEDIEFAKILRGALEVKYPTVQASVVVVNNNNNNSSSSSEHEEGLISFPDFSSSPSSTTKTPQDVKEMLLMAQCDDLIIANSSFSWWSGYFGRFNDSARRVVAPQKWFTGKAFVDQVHIYPPEWIVV